MTIGTRITTRVKQIFETVSARRTLPCYLVYYDGGLTSAAALREACETADAGTRIVAVFLDVVPQTELIEDDAPVHKMLAQGVLAAATANARVYGAHIETVAVSCHVKGTALVALAAEYGNATLFIGVDDSENEALNPFVDFIVAAAPCRVVLVGHEQFEHGTVRE